MWWKMFEFESEDLQGKGIKERCFSKKKTNMREYTKKRWHLKRGWLIKKEGFKVDKRQRKVDTKRERENEQKKLEMINR